MFFVLFFNFEMEDLDCIFLMCYKGLTNKNNFGRKKFENGNFIQFYIKCIVLAIRLWSMLYLRYYFKINIRGFEKELLDSIYFLSSEHEDNKVELLLHLQPSHVFFHNVILLKNTHLMPCPNLAFAPLISSPSQTILL